jgi:hypothetical protein
VTSHVDIYQERLLKLKDTGCKELFEHGGFYHPEAKEDPKLKTNFTDS